MHCVGNQHGHDCPTLRFLTFNAMVSDQARNFNFSLQDALDAS